MSDNPFRDSHPEMYGKVNSSPGIRGAIADLISTFAKATSPRSIAQRKIKLKDQEDEAMEGKRAAIADEM